MYMKKKNVHEASSMLRCGHTKTITVKLLCYVQELNACIVFQKLCRFAHFATFRYKLIHLLCKRESFPVRLLNC